MHLQKMCIYVCDDYECKMSYCSLQKCAIVSTSLVKSEDKVSSELMHDSLSIMGMMVSGIAFDDEGMSEWLWCKITLRLGICTGMFVLWKVSRTFYMKAFVLLLPRGAFFAPPNELCSQCVGSDIYVCVYLGLRSINMLRSKAPSALKRRKNTTEENVFIDETDVAECKKPKRVCTLKRVPLSPIRNRFNFIPNTKSFETIIEEKNGHEELIKKILNRPFKIPIRNYSGILFK